MKINPEWNNAEPQEDNSYDVLPVGIYTAKVRKAEVKEAKTPGNFYINLQVEITGPTHAGRIVFDILNVQNANATAQDIGQRAFANLRAAIGVGEIDDTDELVNGRDFEVSLGIEKDAQYGDRNKIKYYKALAGMAEMPKKAAAKKKPAAKDDNAPPWA